MFFESIIKYNKIFLYYIVLYSYNMSYTRKHKGKKARMTRNNRNRSRNYKKNNKKYSGMIHAATISTATKTGLLGKKAISAVKMGSSLSKGKLSGVGVGLMDDALLHSSHYLFGKKGKKSKKQTGGDDGVAIGALINTLKTIDKMPGITILKTMPAYNTFSKIKDKLIDLLDIVQNQDIQVILNNNEISEEKIKNQIKIIIGGDENIKKNIKKFKDVCSNLDKITSLPIIGKQLDKAIPHREELCMAFTEFDINENINNEEKNTIAENLEEKNTIAENLEENTDNVLEENTIAENQENTIAENLEENTDNVLEENTITENLEENTDNVLEENIIVENPDKSTENKNCIKTSGFVETITGADKFCYKEKQQGAGSRKSYKKTTKKSKKSNKKHRKGSRKTKKSYRRQHKKK